MGQRNRVKNKNDNQSQQSIYKPEEIFKIKKETDQYLKSIKRYTYRSTTAATSLLQENTLVKRDKNIDDEGIKKFKKELSQQMKREKEALIILADEIRKKTYQTPTDLFFDQSVRDELLFPRITDSK